MDMIVGLYQKYTRERLLESDDFNEQAIEAFIQFRIYQVLDDNEAIEANKNCSRLYAKHLEKILSSGCYVNLNEVIRRFKLAPGSYVIIPSCYDSRKAQFILRIGSKMPIEYENSTILEEFKTILDREDIYFPIQNTQISSDKKDNVINEYKFYIENLALKDSDRMNTKKMNKYFD